MDIFGIKYSELLKKTRIDPGDTVNVMIYSEKGTRSESRKTKVLEVHRHHVLLDFGKYKECRRIADIALGLVNT